MDDNKKIRDSVEDKKNKYKANAEKTLRIPKQKYKNYQKVPKIQTISARRQKYQLNSIQFIR